MSISGALSNAISGMAAVSRRAEVAAHNIANASTEGYARQSVSLTAGVGPRGNGTGVQINAPERATSPHLTASRREADAQSGGDAAQASAARALADVFQGPTSLFSQLSALETNLRSASETPESTALQERVVSTASGVSASFQAVSQTIQQQRSEADYKIGAAVSEVNAALEQIQELNYEISASRNSGVGSASFEQRRDEQIDIVAQHIPIRLMSRDGGQVAIFTNTGVSLLDGKARELEFAPTAIVSPDMGYRAGNGGLSGLSVNGIELAPGGGNQALDSGSIAGLFEARDGFLVDAIAEVDALAADVVARFEGAGIAGADGRGLFTNNGGTLASDGSVGLAARIQVNERVDPSQGGEVWRIRDGLDAAVPGPPAASDHIRSMLNAMTELRGGVGSLASDGSASDLAGALGSLFERRGQSLEDTAVTSQAKLATLENAEAGEIGVDIDQELQQLLVIEQAYAANAKVIQVADSMVQRLLEI